MRIPLSVSLSELIESMGVNSSISLRKSLMLLLLMDLEKVNSSTTLLTIGTSLLAMRMNSILRMK